MMFWMADGSASGGLLLQNVFHVVRDLVDLEREEQRLGLEIARLQDEQHPTCQAVVAIGHRTFFRREGEIVGRAHRA